MSATIDTTDLDYQLGVMQAFKAGRAVQIRTRLIPCEWGDDETPLWSWAAYEYRVKPDPMDLLTELAGKWSDESRRLRKEADVQKQQYGTNNSVYVFKDTQSRTLGTCCGELLKCIRKMKEASK